MKLSETNANFAAIAAIALAVVALYAHTLQTPFYLDDIRVIDNNYLLGKLGATFNRILTPRGVTNYSFALNFLVFGDSVTALHLINIVIHAVSGCLVFLLLKQLVSGRWLPLSGAILFVAHPLQTQAVTYAVQRAASLATLFVLLAFLFHLRARNFLAEGHGRTSRPYLLAHLSAVIAGALAVLSKENTIILPLILVIYDCLFPLPAKRTFKQSILDNLPFFIAPLLLVLYWYGINHSAIDSVPTHAPLSSLRGITPLHYLVTEFSVIWIYIRLLAIPYGQALEHNYPIVQQVLTLENSVALLGLVALLVTAWRIRAKRPLVTFGVAWFFLGLCVESSVIPLDPLIEHRLYLPMFGVILVALDGLPALLGQRRGLILICLAILIYAPLTWKRNQLWQNPVSFYEDNLRKYPDSERALAGLSHHYRQSGRLQEIQQILESTLQRYPKNYIAYRHLAFSYFEQGRQQEALDLLDRGIKILPENFSLYEAAATLSAERNDPTAAIDYLERGIARVHGFRFVLINKLGELYLAMGDSVQAERVLREGLKSNPDNALIHLSLGKALYAQERWAEALIELKRALHLAPENPEPIEGIGKSALQIRDMSTARWALKELERFDSAGWQRLSSAFQQIEQTDRGGK